MSRPLADAQREMAAYLRDPAGENPPADIEARRLQVYRDLVYRNIEGFISSGFPILRSLYDDSEWEALVREFIQTHRCSTPLFLRISEEFLAYLAAREARSDRPFEAELAHYEWLELAVDVAEGEVPSQVTGLDVESAIPQFSDTASLGSYHFPVHRIGPSFQPRKADQPSFLLVYRDRDERVQFMELNAGTARLLQALMENRAQTAAALLDQLAAEWGMAAESVREFGWQQLVDFNERGVIRLQPASE